MKIIFAGLIIVAMYVCIMALRLFRTIKVSKTAAWSTRPYQRPIKSARQHVLILGDSTMYGAGIKDPAHTMGGLLAAKFPLASIETLAVNGAKVRDLHVQLKQAQFRHYTVIMTGIGGNDIVGLSHYKSVQDDLMRFLETASLEADKIILFHCVNVGNIGFFMFPLNYLYSYRTRKISQLFDQVAQHFPNVQYVNFYRPMSADYYNKQTRKNFVAEDSFHPNDYANQYFFNIIWKELESNTADNKS